MSKDRTPNVEVDLKPCPVCSGDLRVSVEEETPAHGEDYFCMTAWCPCGFEYITGTCGTEQIAAEELTTVLNDRGDVSDGWHTFDELYEHRLALTVALVNALPEGSAYKAKKHSDGSMFDDSFIVVIDTPNGPVTYHYGLEYWDWFDIPSKRRAQEWDGATPADSIRRLTGREPIVSKD